MISPSTDRFRDPSAIPQTLPLLVSLRLELVEQHLHGVRSPDDQGEAGNGKEEGSNLLALGLGLSSAVDGQVPDDDQVGNAGNGIPTPLLGSALATESSKKTRKDHYDVCGNSHEDVGAIEASEQAEIEQEQRSGQGPVDVASPEDLAFDGGEGIWGVVMLVTDCDGVDRDTVTGSHGKVGDGGDDGDEGGYDMVQATADGNTP